MKPKNNKIKSILLTIFLYIVDIAIWGSYSGAIFVMMYGVVNLTTDSNCDLITMYLVGVAWYWFADSIYSKFRIHFRDARNF